MNVCSSPLIAARMKDNTGSLKNSCQSSNFSLDDSASRCGSMTGASLDVSLDMEYDDYPLDLISPLVVNPCAKTAEFELSNSDFHSDMAAIFKNAWKPPSPPPLRDKQIDRTIGDEMITDYGRRSCCDYPENTDLNEDVFINYRASLCLSQQSQSTATCTDRSSTVIARDISDETHFIEPDESSNNKHTCYNTCKWKCLKVCKPCMLKYNILPDKPNCLDRLKYGCLCPPHGWLSKVLSFILTVAAVWGVCWAFIGRGAAVGGEVFALLVISVVGYIAGHFMQLIKLPPFIGMLLVGVLMRNVPGINLAENITPKFAFIIRCIGLTIYLLNISLSLSMKSMRKTSVPVLRLASLPCILEAIVVGISARFLLNLPWLWAYMLGFLTSSLGGGAVLKPYLSSLYMQGYGREEGVHSLLISAVVLEDKLTIITFSLLLGIVFTQGSTAMIVFIGPLEVLGGIVFGGIVGILLWYIPGKHHSDVWLLRVVLMTSAGLFAIAGSQSLLCPGAGVVGCLFTGVLANIKWKHYCYKGEKNQATNYIKKLWYIAEPLVIGVIGAEVEITKSSIAFIGLSVCVLLIGCAIRVLTTFTSVLGMGLTMKEKLFFPCAWTSKGILQVLLCCLSLDTAIYQEADAQVIFWSKQVILVAVLEVMLTVPISSLLLHLTGSRLLTRSKLHLEECRAKIDLNNPQAIDARSIEITAEFETVT